MKYKIELLSAPMSHKEFRRHCKGLRILNDLIHLGLIERFAPDPSETILVPTLEGTWAPQQISPLIDPGALVMDSEGVYRQVNFGIVRGPGTLDQEAVIEALGDATIAPIDSNKQIKKMRLINLDESTYNILRVYGNGNLSEGIRRAARVADTAVNNEWEALPETGPKRQAGVSLDDSTVDILKRIGFGNMSAGARRAARYVR